MGETCLLKMKHAKLFIGHNSNEMNVRNVSIAKIIALMKHVVRVELKFLKH